MASLRFNYDGEKRSERGRPIYEANMVRRTGYPFPRPFSMPPVPQPSPQPQEVKDVPLPQEPSIASELQTEAAILPAEDVAPAPEEAVEKTEPSEKSEQKSEELPAEPSLSVSEKFIASLESYENGVVKIRQQVDSSKLMLDEVLFHMDSFMKILDILKEREERKQNLPQVAVTQQKAGKDTIDEVLELLQTPAMQNILRQVLMGILIKK